MAASSRKYVKRSKSLKEKRVSFRDLEEDNVKDETVEQKSVNRSILIAGKQKKSLEENISDKRKGRKWNDKEEDERREKLSNSNVEITELFSDMRSNPEASTPRVDETSITPRKPKLSTPQVTVVKKAEKLPPFKHPTESLSHALLRTMSNRESSDLKKRSLPKLVILQKHGAQPAVSADKKILMHKLHKMKQEQLLISPEDNAAGLAPGNPDDEVTSVRPADVTSVRLNIRCDVCRKEQKVVPASGFCKLCGEFLCAKCIHVHKSRITRCHPVVVFYCDTCKELNILNKRGAGFCVKCKRYYCSVCVVQHCFKTNHDVLEGEDLLDVVQVTTQV